MALDATQKSFIITQLGVQANRGFFDVVDKVTDYMLSGALDEYLVQEKQILDYLDEMRGIAGAERIVTEIERQTTEAQKKVRDAKRDGGAGPIKEATATLVQQNKDADRVVKNKDFYIDVDKAEKALETLKGHKQRAHIAGELKASADALQLARQQASTGNFKDAKTSLKTATDANAEGKRCADAFGTVVPVKADTMRIVGSLKGVFSDAAYWQARMDAATNAAAKADPGTRDYDGAKNDLRGVVTGLKNQMVTWWVTNEPTGLADLRLNQTKLAQNSGGATIVDGDLTKINDMRTQISNDINASNWGAAALAAQSQLGNLVTAAKKLSDRRLEFDKQRKITKTDLDALDPHKKVLRLQLESLTKLLAKADGMATREAMLFEDGIAGLKEISVTAKALLAVATDSAGYLRERVEADKKLKALKETDAAKAGVLDTQLQGIDALMAAAASSTGVLDAEASASKGLDMEDERTHQLDWAGARKTVGQAVLAMTAAETLGTSLKDSVGLAENAANADDLPKIQKAVEDLRKRAEEAKKKPFKDKADHEFLHVGHSLDEALQQATDGHLDIAAIPLQGAAGLLIEAETVQSEYARFDAAFKIADAAQKKLLALTDPPAVTLKAKTDAIAEQMKAATKEADARAWDKAFELLRQITAALAEAKDLGDTRKTFNAKATRITNAAASLDVTLKNSIGQVITDATKKADEFNFMQAGRLLDNADAQLASAAVKTKAISGTLDQAFKDAVDKMMAAEGGDELVVRAKNNKDRDSTKLNGPELLDELVKNLPDDVPLKMLVFLVKKRFNIDLRVSALYFDSGELKETIPDDPTQVEQTSLQDFSKRTKSAKKIYEMLAVTPEQSRDNPSLKKVDRENVLKNIKFNASTGNNSFDFTNGGYYAGDKNYTSMSGRPGDIKQQFGSKQTSAKRDANNNPMYGTDGALIKEKELPPAESAVYEPANETEVDYFDFANVHETGHSVDDRLQFMAKRAGQAAFGNWITHGSNIKPIADQVLAKYAAGQEDVLRDYVNDLIIGAKPDIPAVDPADQVAINTACKDIDAWHKVGTGESIWWDQGNSTAQTMLDGRVYQEAYKKTWVSYPISERAKGITGYQFRAPGEWFAELYAAYHLGKLKPGHPARAWLAELKI